MAAKVVSPWEKVYFSLMLPFVGFIAIQVWQIKVNSEVNHATLNAHEKRLDVIESIVLRPNNHQKEKLYLPLTLPLVTNKDEHRTSMRPQNAD